MTTPKQQEAIEFYVERAAAMGIDPTKARAEAVAMTDLLREFKAPAAPQIIPAPVLRTLIPHPSGHYSKCGA